jgi:hypothetical protein
MKFSKITDGIVSASGIINWINLRWYPIIFQIYATGVAAVEGKKYDVLKEIFYTQNHVLDYRHKQQTVCQSLGDAIQNLNGSSIFKQIPGHERNYHPFSEYLYKKIQPYRENSLFIGKNYEASFDEFEIMLGLAVAHKNNVESNHAWGPVGRFGWKHRSDNSMMKEIINAAKNKKGNWEPIKQGMFDGNYEQFLSAAEKYSEILSQSSYF